MLEYGTCCGCLSLRKECIVFGLVDLITEIPHIDVDLDGGNAFIDLVLVVIGFFLAGLLVCGAIWRNLFCLWLWIFIQIIRTLVLCVGLTYGIIALTTDSDSSLIAAAMQQEFDFKELNLLTALIGIHILINSFVIVMVYRYIYQLIDNESFECEECNAHVGIRLNRGVNISAI